MTPKCWDFESVGKYEIANLAIKSAYLMFGKRFKSKDLGSLKLSPST